MGRVLRVIIKGLLFLIVLCVLGIMTHKYNRDNKPDKVNLIFLLASDSLIMLFVFILFLALSSMPNIYIDEANCMYDSWCIAQYGVDSNLMKNPVYLQSFAGQGQSVLYAYLAGPFLKYLGYDIFAFRLPLVLISIISVIVLFQTLLLELKPVKVFPYVLVIVTAPWVIMTSRWGMDCNVAPFIFFIGFCLLYQGLHKNSLILEVAATLLIGLTAYAYNVAWIFLPLTVIGLAVGMLARKKITKRRALLLSGLLFIEIIPILLFAIRSNIPAWNETKRILFWTSPKLLVNRSHNSMIGFDENVIQNIILNLKNGFEIFWYGYDELPWNALSGIGPYYLFTMPFFVIGLFKLITDRTFWHWMIGCIYLGMLPVMMLATPNFNHWIFIHFAVLLTIGTGVEEICSGKKTFYVSMIATYGIASLVFMNAYFHGEHYSGWQMDTVQMLKELHTEEYEKVYFDRLDLTMVRDFLPVSPYEFQKTKDYPYSDECLLAITKYSNFEQIDDQKELAENSLVMVTAEHSDSYYMLISDLEFVRSMIIEDEEYYIYTNR